MSTNIGQSKVSCLHAQRVAAAHLPKEMGYTFGHVALCVPLHIAAYRMHLVPRTLEGIAPDHAAQKIDEARVALVDYCKLAVGHGVPP